MSKALTLQKLFYSFPMKYHPLLGEFSHNRNYIGKHWNRKYIRSIQAILQKEVSVEDYHIFIKHLVQIKMSFIFFWICLTPILSTVIFFEWLKEKEHPLSTYNWM